jgi:hypothetical protein
MLYVRFQNGYVSLIEANPKEYRRVSTIRTPEVKGNCWAHPVVIGGRFYVREQDAIWCYDVRAR